MIKMYLVFTSFLLMRNKEQKSLREHFEAHENWGHGTQYRYTCLHMYLVVSDKLQQYPRRLDREMQCN